MPLPDDHVVEIYKAIWHVLLNNSTILKAFGRSPNNRIRVDSGKLLPLKKTAIVPGDLPEIELTYTTAEDPGDDVDLDRTFGTEVLVCPLVDQATHTYLLRVIFAKPDLVKQMLIENQVRLTLRGRKLRSQLNYVRNVSLDFDRSAEEEIRGTKRPITEIEITVECEKE